MEQREQALARRHAKKEKDLTEHTKLLAPLIVGQVVLVQNQTGNNPLRWNKSGQVVEVLPFDQYRIKMDGTGRSSLRNRKFLRLITPFSKTTVDMSDSTPGTLTTDANDVINETDENTPPTQGHSDDTSVIRRSARPSKTPVRLGIASNTCSRSSHMRFIWSPQIKTPTSASGTNLLESS